MYMICRPIKFKNSITEKYRQLPWDVYTYLCDINTLSESMMPLTSVYLLYCGYHNADRILCHHLHFVLNNNYLIDLQIKLVNISSNDIVDGNTKITLGLVWNIILHWQVGVSGEKGLIEKGVIECSE